MDTTHILCACARVSKRPRYGGSISSHGRVCVTQKKRKTNACEIAVMKLDPNLRIIVA